MRGRYSTSLDDFLPGELCDEAVVPLVESAKARRIRLEEEGIVEGDYERESHAGAIQGAPDVPSRGSA